MWEVGSQYVQNPEDYNQILKSLDGKELDDHIAKVSLARFLQSNIGFTFQLMTGIELLPVQELILKSLFLADNSLVVAGRGLGKSFLISTFCLLAPILYPNSKTCIISANFRSARRILEMAQKIIKGNKAQLMAACFNQEMRRGNDEWKVKLTNGSEVFALPLSSSQGLRGTRANFLLVDEGLLISKDIQDSIIRPFLTAKQNFREEQEIRDAENYLIGRGLMQEKDRMVFPRNKYMVFSSASYQFEYLYEMYQANIQAIQNPPKDNETPPRYFVMRAGYEVLEQTSSFIDLTQIEAQKAGGGYDSDYFKREYRAMFTNCSDSYFNAQKMAECTVSNGSLPSVQVKGEKDCQYILAIDPSYSASKSSDFFGMGVYALMPSERKICLVHTYARAGGELKEHFSYLVYLLTFFDIRFIVIDASGSEFIDGFSASSIAKERNINLKFFSEDINFDCPAEKYDEMVSRCKNEYNLSNRRIVYGQKFMSDYIRTMNEHLQNQIEAKRVWFASQVTANDTELKKALEIDIPFDFKNNQDAILSPLEFLEAQDNWIRETKSQVALVECRASALGNLTFDLPASIKRSTSKDRPRKDLYTCLLMANYAAKHYYNVMFTETKKVANTFTPILI